MIRYQERFYSEVFFPYLIANDIKHIIHLGDYYDHRKYVNFKALQSNNRVFLDRLRELGIHMTIIPGNHDLAYRNTSSLCSLIELMAAYRDVVTIHMEPVELELGPERLKVALIPWINPENYEAAIALARNSEARIAMGHFEFKGFAVYQGIEATHGMDHGLWSKFEAVYSGHYHTKSQKANVTYLGSQMEFTWADAGEAKFFHILDTADGSMTPVQNPLTLFQRVIYDDTQFDYRNFDFSLFDEQYVKIMVARKTDPFTFEQFVDKVKTRPLLDLKIVEAIDGTGFDLELDDVHFESTTELIDIFVEGSDTVLDKDRLKLGLRELYLEALTYEVSE